MSYQVVSIGGSGAKSVESLTHLCAAGLMPDGELNVLFVDPDLANGCLERTQNTLNRYCECKKTGMKQTGLLKTSITLSKPNVWTPFEETAKPKLGDFFRYPVLKTQYEPAAHLFDVLFSPVEKEVLLDEGFLGHPSIGAAVMAKTVKLGETEPWQTFRRKIEQDAKEGEGSKIVLIGSVFGGTGAAGIPTIARLIKQEFKGYKNIKVGGVLLLPYFSFIAAEKKLNSGKSLKLNPQNFVLNTQAALKYYYNQNYLDCFDCIYLIGEHMLTPLKHATSGGRNQSNEPNFMELYSALATIDFFNDIDEKVKDPTFEARKYQLIAREKSGEVQWSDLPDGNNGNIVKRQLGTMTRFAFAYLNVYYPMLENIRTKEKTYRSPWYIQFFERKGISLNSSQIQDQLKNMKEYCETFLKWMANLHKSNDQLEIEFVGYKAFAKEKDKTMYLLPNFDGSLFENLILPEGKANADGLNDLWERMCDNKALSPQEAAVGDFFKAVFEESDLIKVR
ncbi:MAG: hypothetical protein KAT34_20455 [Candidatus Aminicenantes bacterium]|nr:hypothetical protein [Candidatus Aminicenantes bacterium]